MTATKEQITVLLPLITPYSMPADQTASDTLYSIACSRLTKDAPTLSQCEESAEALCWYIAHLLSNQDTSARLSSKTLGSYSVSYVASTDGATAYLAEYNRIISAESAVGNCDIITHSDGELADSYALDTLTIGGLE